MTASLCRLVLPTMLNVAGKWTEETPEEIVTWWVLRAGLCLDPGVEEARVWRLDSSQPIAALAANVIHFGEGVWRRRSLASVKTKAERERRSCCRGSLWMVLVNSGS